MEYLRKFLKIHYIILALIILAAIFFRSYHHEKFLNFQLDQARDGIIVSNFVNYGMEKIPLLGPHVKGGELQLGPVFYYIQSIPAFFFGTSPNILAFPDLIFSILFVPFLYFFLRLYFSRNICLVISAISATSLFLIIYGRFSWNPNSLPFFTLLTILGLLKTNWKGKVKPKWFYAAIASASIASQLHFVFFFIAPIFIIIYLVAWRPQLKFKNYLIGFLIILAIHSPIIINNLKNQGENYKSLLKTATEKSTENGKHNLLEKSFHAYQGIQKNYWQIITSDEHKGSISFSKKFYPICNRECREEFPIVTAQNIILFLGILLSLLDYFREKDKDRKKFIFSALLWFGLAFFVFSLIAYDISERYYLVITVPFFVILGITLEKINKKLGETGKIALILIASFLILSNLRNDFIYIREHAKMSVGEVTSPRGNSFFNDEKITLEQLEIAVNYIKDSNPSEFPVRVVSDNKYARSIYYLLKYQEDTPACYIKWSSFHPTGANDCFLILQADWEKNLPNEFNDLFFVEAEKKFGNLDIFYLRAKKTDLKSFEEDICLAE